MSVKRGSTVLDSLQHPLLGEATASVVCGQKVTVSCLNNCVGSLLYIFIVIVVVWLAYLARLISLCLHVCSICTHISWLKTRLQVASSKASRIDAGTWSLARGGTLMCASVSTVIIIIQLPYLFEISPHL